MEWLNLAVSNFVKHVEEQWLSLDGWGKMIPLATGCDLLDILKIWGIEILQTDPEVIRLTLDQQDPPLKKSLKNSILNNIVDYKSKTAENSSLFKEQNSVPDLPWSLRSVALQYQTNNGRTKR